MKAAAIALLLACSLPAAARRALSASPPSIPTEVIRHEQMLIAAITPTSVQAVNALAAQLFPRIATTDDILGDVRRAVEKRFPAQEYMQEQNRILRLAQIKLLRGLGQRYKRKADERSRLFGMPSRSLQSRGFLDCAGMAVGGAVESGAGAASGAASKAGKAAKETADKAGAAAAGAGSQAAKAAGHTASTAAQAGKAAHESAQENQKRQRELLTIMTNIQKLQHEISKQIIRATR